METIKTLYKELQEREVNSLEAMMIGAAIAAWALTSAGAKGPLLERCLLVVENYIRCHVAAAARLREDRDCELRDVIFDREAHDNAAKLDKWMDCLLQCDACSEKDRCPLYNLDSDEEVK